ncbi:hypothetical protein X975_25309, partial [Stegodyphus mimosarum]
MRTSQEIHISTIIYSFPLLSPSKTGQQRNMTMPFP